MNRIQRNATCVVATIAATIILALASAVSAKTELLVFSSPYCMPCQQLKPAIDQLAAEGFPIVRVDITQQPQLAERFNVTRVPCLVLVGDGGTEITRSLGGTDASVRQMFASAGVQTGRNEQQPMPQLLQDPAAIERPSLAAQPVHSNPAAASPAASAVDPGFETKLLESTVRITVNDSTGKSYGTGTIIDTREGDALAVTCGHLFRGDAAKGQIVIERYSVTPAGLQVVERMKGQLESYDLEREVGLISFRPQSTVRVAAVSPQFGEQVNDRVWSVGCDMGADPTVRDSRVTAIDRYRRAPNIETSGAPVQGRSGGGLFNARGQLVGICFAADEQADEGLYSGLACVHAELDRLGLQAIYQGEAGGAALVASNSNNNRMAPLPPIADSDRVVRGQDPMSPAAARSSFPVQPASLSSAAPLQPLASPVGTPALSELPPVERAGLEEIAKRASESEVVVIVRPRDGSSSSEVITLDRVSPQFVEALRAMQP